MQLPAVAILTVLATSAYATPMSHIQFPRIGCDIAGCVTALAPSVVACATAASIDGTDVPADVSCLTAAATVVQNFPASCDNCAEEFGLVNAINSAAGAVGDVAEPVVHGVGDAAGKVGDAIGSIFKS